MYCNTIEITHIRVTRMMIDINGKHNMRFLIYTSESLNWKATSRWLLCHATIAQHANTITSRPSNRHHPFDINLTSNTGCNRWASGHHKRALVSASLVKHHHKSHHLGWLPCHYFTTWHENSHVQVSTGTTIPPLRQATADVASHMPVVMKPAHKLWQYPIGTPQKHGLVPLHNCHHPLARESHL